MSCRSSYAFRAVGLQSVPVEGRDLSSRTSVRFLVFGDSGTGDASQQVVAAGMREVCAATPCDFALLLGDAIYETGVTTADDPRFGPRFHAPYDPLGLDIWVVPGNHDWYSRATLQPAIAHSRHPSNASGAWKMPFNYFEVPRLPRWLHLFGLDTTVLHDLAEQGDAPDAVLVAVADAQRFEARRALCGQPGWRLLFGHHFLYSSGSGHGTETGLLQGQLGALIDACEVQVLFSGHDHHQEHLVVDGFHQVIQGAGGRLRRVDAAPDGAEQRFAEAALGFAVVEASETSMTTRFYTCQQQSGCGEAYDFQLNPSGTTSADRR